MARYYEPRNGVFLSLDPDPGSDGDSLDQNGYAYGNNNPVMNVDPDGHWVWLAINAGFAAYDGYKAYKSGKGWRGVAKAAAYGFVGGGRFKLTKRAYSSIRNIYKVKKTKRIAKKFKYDSTAYKRAKNGRYVPRRHIASTIVYGKRKHDGAKGYSAYYSTMYKNGRKYSFKVVYNKRTKRVRHFHYKDYYKMKK
ncbi:hypothetical protein AXI58_05200 [Bacillus nakamurai]|uniref:Type IV secretion protein Rhs n=1 Tax=Bacillus nakamurai TaxID=1793963 RepID=A0A150F2I2_9BACI|nr:hypothetical protein AXI58_05200 [Bacillus nakamurai]